MEQNLDYELMAEFVDALISRKGGETAEARNELIAKLEDYINTKLIDGLTDEQLQEFSSLLDSADSTPVTVREFFGRAGIDYNQRVKDAMTEFAKDYLGELYGN